MGKIAARRAVRFKNDAATMRGSVTGAKTVADTVNSDAVSERSAKRVPLRVYSYSVKMGSVAAV